MEFMFRDDAASSPGTGAVPGPVIATPGSEGAAPDAMAAEPATGSRPPVTHWGSHKGTIRSAFLRDPAGAIRHVVAWGEDIEAVIQLRLPADVPRENLSVAISVKDLRGTDVMVCTTHDGVPQELPPEAELELAFRFRNCLAPGKYLIVAAVEKRQGSDIYYYEYVEGAHYFASTSEWMMFGVFRPEVELRIRACAELDS
jgi:lipopolysaccharide transport system ATP-binding protein